MFIRRVIILGTVAALAALTPQAFADQPGPSVTGSGQTTVNGANRTFTVDAHQAADGSVSGQSELQSRNTDNTYHITVNCLEVIGNTAYVSGTVTHSTEVPQYEGWTAVFSARDNHKASPDQISLAYLSSPASGLDCTNEHPVPDLTVQNGNVTIHS